MSVRLDLPNLEIINLYESGLTVKQVGAHFGVTEPTIRKRLMEAGVRLRNKTEAAAARIARGVWTCKRCGIEKNLDAFRTHETRVGNAYPLRTCYECELGAQREYSHRADVADRRKAKNLAYNATPLAKAQRKTYAALKADKIRIARAAYERVRRAVKSGQLVKPSACEQCGEEKRLEAAHHDYSKPLAVRWLCLRCHRLWDAAQPKLLGDQRHIRRRRPALEVAS